MSEAAQKYRLDAARDRAGGLDLAAEYLPDEVAEARALLLIAGVPEEEIERVISEMALESEREM
jgi:hypothetical protein